MTQQASKDLSRATEKAWSVCCEEHGHVRHYECVPGCEHGHSWTYVPCSSWCPDHALLTGAIDHEHEWVQVGRGLWRRTICSDCRQTFPPGSSEVA